MSRGTRRAVAIALAALAIIAFGYAELSSRWLANPTARLARVDGDLVVPIGPEHAIAFGLRGAEVCVDGGCERWSNTAFMTRWELDKLTARYAIGQPVGDQLRALGGDDAFAAAERARDRVNREIALGGSHARDEAELLEAVEVTSAPWPALGWITTFALALAMLALAGSAILVATDRRTAWPIQPTTLALLGVAIALVVGCVFAAIRPGPPGYVGLSLGFFAFAAGVMLALGATLMLNGLLRPEDPDLLEDAINPDEF